MVFCWSEILISCLIAVVIFDGVYNTYLCGGEIVVYSLFNLHTLVVGRRDANLSQLLVKQINSKDHPNTFFLHADNNKDVFLKPSAPFFAS